jgi:flagellar biosynthetic protein FliO
VTTVTSQVDTNNNIGTFNIEKVRDELITRAVDSNAVDTNAEPKQERIAAVLLRVFFYLAVVIILIFVVSWVVKKAGITGSSKVGGGGAMDTLEVLPLGQNRNIILIRVMDVVYLLGQTSGSMILLEKIEGQKAIDLISSSKGGSSIIQFKDALNSFMGKIKKSS